MLLNECSLLVEAWTLLKHWFALNKNRWPSYHPWFIDINYYILSYGHVPLAWAIMHESISL